MAIREPPMRSTRLKTAPWSFAAHPTMSIERPPKFERPGSRTSSPRDCMKGFERGGEELARATRRGRGSAGRAPRSTSPGNHLPTRCTRSFSFSKQKDSIRSVSGSRRWLIVMVNGLVYIVGSSTVI